jgi:hypothetical protein
MTAEPLSRSLELKPGQRLFVSSAPYPPVGADIKSLLDEFPPVQHPQEADVQLFFTTSQARLAEAFATQARLLPLDGGLWIAWPKESSPLNVRLQNDLSFEDVRRIGLDAGLVDNKSCSIDENWQALRFANRVEDQPTAAR